MVRYVTSHPTSESTGLQNPHARCSGRRAGVLRLHHLCLLRRRCGALFFPADIPEWLRQVQTFGIFAAGYLARPLGGIVMAHFGDLVGRKKMFTLSILLMAVPTLAIGLLPTYESMGIIAPLLLLLMRILQARPSAGSAGRPGVCR